MIFPRTRSASRRYQRSKLIAIVVTFLIGWLAVKVVPDKLLPKRWVPSGPPTPREAFQTRDTDVWVEADAVLEAVLADSLAPGAAVAFPRWRMRSTEGHPFTLLQDPAAGLLEAGTGDTVSVRGMYGWDPGGGTVVTVVPE